MKNTYVFRGRTHRVQLVIYDWTTDDTPQHMREPRPKFCVYVLPASANKSTAFRVAGTKLYWGDDPDEAYDHIHRHIGDSLFNQMSGKLRRYLVGWAKS